MANTDSMGACFANMRVELSNDLGEILTSFGTSLKSSLREEFECFRRDWESLLSGVVSTQSTAKHAPETNEVIVGPMLTLPVEKRKDPPTCLLPASAIPMQSVTSISSYRRSHAAKRALDAVGATLSIAGNPKKLSVISSHSVTESLSGKGPQWKSDLSIIYSPKAADDDVGIASLKLGERSHARSKLWGGKQSQRDQATMVVDSAWFNSAIGVLLVMNAITIGLQADIAARTLNDVPFGLRVVEWVFCSIFVIELSLRIYAYRCQFFSMSGWSWNIFDFTVVLLQVLDEITFIIFGHGSSTTSSATMFRVVRMLRLLRVLRLARILHLVQELHILVNSIMASLKSFFWTVFLLLILIFLFGVYITQIVADARQDGERNNIVHWDSLDKYWGNLGYALLTLFEAMSGGVDWDDVCRPLMDDISPLMALVLFFYISISLFIVMNLVTGIFVESAAKNIKDDQDLRLVRQICQLFVDSDTDKTGSISWEEFEGRLDNPLMEEYLCAVDMSPSDAQLFFDLIDVYGNREVGAEDFVHGCLHLRGPARAIDLAILKKEMHESIAKIESTLQSFRGEATSLSRPSYERMSTMSNTGGAREVPAFSSEPSPPEHPENIYRLQSTCSDFNLPEALPCSIQDVP